MRQVKYVLFLMMLIITTCSSGNYKQVFSKDNYEMQNKNEEYNINKTQKKKHGINDFKHNDGKYSIKSDRIIVNGEKIKFPQIYKMRNSKKEKAMMMYN